VLEAVGDLARVHRDQPDAHARVALAEAGGDARGQRERGGDRADPQRALEPAAQARGLLLERLEVGERALRPAEDQLALGGQRLELAPAADERHAELTLEAPDAR